MKRGERDMQVRKGGGLYGCPSKISEILERRQRLDEGSSERALPGNNAVCQCETSLVELACSHVG